MKLFIIALLVAISYAQTGEAAEGLATGSEASLGVAGGTGESEAVETPEAAETPETPETSETGAGDAVETPEAAETPETPETPEAGAGETATGVTTGATTGEIPSMPSTGGTSTGTATGATALLLPCKMRTMNCQGRSPSGGRCYMKEMGKCEEAEAGDGDYMCVGLGMTACSEQRAFCFWDPSDMECTSNKELEYPMMAGVGGITIPEGFANQIPNGFAMPEIELPEMGEIQSGAAMAGVTPQGMVTAMATCAGYTFTNLALCTYANGCYRDEEQCKPIAAKMGEVETPEIEAPEGMMPGMMGQLPGLSPLSKTQEAKPAQDTSSKSSVPHELLYGTAGFFGGILISVVIYFLTCGRAKRTPHQDLFLEEYSSRLPVV